MTILLIVETLLLSRAGLGFGAGWQLAPSYGLQLRLGLWLFFLLLTRQNQPSSSKARDALPDHRRSKEVSPSMG